MKTVTESVAERIRRIQKREIPDEVRAASWQQVCSRQGLSGEFALAQRMGEAAYTDEQAKMVAELFGR